MWCVAELDEQYIARMEDVLAVYEKPLSTRDGPNPARKPRPKTVAGKKCGAWPNSMSNISRAWRMCWRCMKSRSRRETVRILLESHDLKPWREKNVVRGRTR